MRIALNNFFIITLLSVFLISCGGSSESKSEEKVMNDSNGAVENRSIIEKDFAFESDVYGVIENMLDDHIYELKIDNHVELNIDLDSRVYGVYYHPEPGSIWPHQISPILYLTDDDFNIIGQMQKSNYIDSTPINYVFKNIEPGTYYIIFGQPTWYLENKLKSIDARSGQHDYFFYVKKMIKDEIIYGSDKADFIRGIDGLDQQIYGESGDDIIHGMTGNNYIYGDDGNDTIYGSKGTSSLTGGSGNNTFVYTKLTDSSHVAFKRDTITDFVSGKDLIDLSATLTSLSSPEDMRFYDGQEPDSSSMSYSIWFVDEVLYMNLNSSSAIEVDFSLALPGVASLSRSDLILKE